MITSSVSPVSFKGYVPVKCYAKDPDNGEYLRITDKENIKKCQGFVVRNLNGTAKNIKNDVFVSFYKSNDRDYARCPKVISVYDKDSPSVIMVTGQDTDVLKNFAKPVGEAKGYALETTGSARSFESRQAAKKYFYNVKAYLRNTCKRLKDNDGDSVSLAVYFNPKYSKKGLFKGFEYEGAEFIKE